MKTIVVGLIAALIVYLVFRKIYKDYKKNKNFCVDNFIISNKLISVEI